MKRKTSKYVVLALFLVCVLFYLIVFDSGRPNREDVKFFRTRYLNDWRKATINYKQQNDDFPESLFEVYLYNCNDKTKPTPYLSFFTWASIDKEISLIKNKKILEDKALFNKTIAYELVCDGETWFIKEKREDPPLFDKYKFLKVDEDEMLKIDQDGNITLVTPKAEK